MNGKVISNLLVMVVLGTVGSYVVVNNLRTPGPHGVSGTGNHQLPVATVPSVKQILPPPLEQPQMGAARLWFVGDVMLSRQVGQFMAERGYDFPWRGIAPALHSGDRLTINFEGCLSTNRVFDWNERMRFPVTPQAVAAPIVPIAFASLANNHGLDCGIDDFTYTQKELLANNIIPLGHPVTVARWSVGTTTVGNQRIGIIALHTLFVPPEQTALVPLTQELEATTDIQIAYLHWGDEYELRANDSQRLLAVQLAQLGIDIVIGHHPHVVQDVQVIDGTLVFYSLGNFIFDQYFSAAVQEGLAVVLETTPEVQVRLVPVSSASERTQPHVLEGNDRQRFLEDLAVRSDERLATAIRDGVIPILTPLASSSKPSMIAP